MDLVNAAMVGEVGALLRAAVDDRQEAPPDRLGERLLQQGAQIGVHRVHLEEQAFPSLNILVMTSMAGWR